MRRRRLFPVAVVAVLAVGLTSAGSVGATIPTQFVVKKTTNYNSVDRKDASVRCPEFSERTGGGASIDGARRAVRLETSRPIADGWRAVAVETKPHFHKSWSLTVRATCQGFRG